eukprot:SRR837773.2970.p1 GENE.SRR837773.2970~~SRR837773.2970.p1  ORF type:complete len:144 (+),score=34.54 SRR837773.2970:58-432(+)
MEQEFSRDHSWTDRRGASFTLAGEYAYVCGPAAKLEGCTPGTRDANNDGLPPQGFVERINSFIKERRDEGHHGGLPEQHAFLSLEEVLSVRLYSGPAYQPLNEFLRQVGNLTGLYRSRVARIPT